MEFPDGQRTMRHYLLSAPEDIHEKANQPQMSYRQWWDTTDTIGTLYNSLYEAGHLTGMDMYTKSTRRR
eukprot:scaffold439881_cov17-Prasinocladus_malaysianus.AAC.1